MCGGDRQVRKFVVWTTESKSLVMKMTMMREKGSGTGKAGMGGVFYDPTED